MSDFVQGEHIVLQASLYKDGWKCHRCLNFGSQAGKNPFLCCLSMCFCMCGSGHRTEEADSFELVLTNRNIHFKQMKYEYGLCFQKTQTKIIPLEKIQDISLGSDCMGDMCGYANQRGEAYELHVQTAGQGGSDPELSIFCIENPREFKKKVLEAKNGFLHGNREEGMEMKENLGASASVRYEQQDRLIRVLELLERRLQSVEESSPPSPPLPPQSSNHSMV